MSVSRSRSESLSGRVIRLEESFSTMSKAIAQVSVDIETLSNSLIARDKPNYQLWINAGMFIMALFGAVVFPIYLTTGYLKELSSSNSIRIDQLKEHENKIDFATAQRITKLEASQRCGESK